MGRPGLGRHEVSTIGKTVNLAYTDAASTSVQITTTPIKGQKFVVRASGKVHLRQGGSGVAATVLDYQLGSGKDFLITIDNANQSYIAAIAPTGLSGTVQVTENNNQDPGTGASS